MWERENVTTWRRADSDQDRGPLLVVVDREDKARATVHKVETMAMPSVVQRYGAWQVRVLFSRGIVNVPTFCTKKSTTFSVDDKEWESVTKRIRRNSGRKSGNKETLSFSRSSFKFLINRIHQYPNLNLNLSICQVNV